MKNDLAEARAQYGRVAGALASIAEKRLRELDSKKAEETIKWLATAELPKPATPTGPGTPGSRPGFEASTPPTDTPGAGATMEEILGNIGAEADADRYSGDQAAPSGDAAATAATEGPAGDAAAETPAEEPPASDAPAEQAPASAETPAAEAAATDDAAEEPAAAGASAPQ
jgi:hypothetical protein